MLIHPQFNPIALQIGPLAVRWYGLMYLLAFLSANLLARWRARLPQYSDQKWSAPEIDNLLIYLILGTILGGRLGYVLFYQASFYIAHPLAIFKIWEGGMSFHGGLIGVMCATFLFAMRHARPWLQVADYIAVLVPPGLAAGRFGNFMNAELWGRVTHPQAPWAMLFPQAVYEDANWLITHSDSAQAMGLYAFFDIWHALPRHPSQLYELVLEGLVLGIVIWWFARKTRPMGAVSAVFLIGYGIARFVIEFAREPDSFLGPLVGGLSRGQWLSLPMILVGAIVLIWVYYNYVRKTRHP